MRTKILRSVISTALALTLVQTLSVVPARASSADGASGSIITIIFTGYRIFKSGQLSASDVEQLVREAVGAVTAMEVSVTGHIDNIVASDVMNDAKSAGRDMANYQAFRDNEIVLWNFAMFLNRAAGNSYAKYYVVQDRKAKDQIGMAASTLYPLALAVRTDAGATVKLDEIKAEHLALLRSIYAELAPTCTSRIAPDTPGYITETRYECVAANGERASDYQIYNESTGKWVRGPVSVDDVRERAIANSSWRVARDTINALP